MSEWTIWKFPLKLTDSQFVEMPDDAHILCVKMKNGVLTMWAQVNPTFTKRYYQVLIVGTGNPAPEPERGQYIDSVFDGPFVWHVFA